MAELGALRDRIQAVLYLGRRRRLHSKPQRLAMALHQDGQCNVKGCDRPAS